ncbi:MAG: nucleoside hydrolase [Promethearchaeota archaeon]
MKDKNFRDLIDTDPGLGTRSADIDDGLALFLMFNNPEFFKIEGITTIFGNTPVNKGFNLLKKYLNIVNRENIPHKLGACSKDDFGTLNDASRFLIEIVKENPNELTLLPLGPLTNIATALKHYPEFFDNLKKIDLLFFKTRSLAFIII